MKHIISICLICMLCAPAYLAAQNSAVNCVHSPNWEKILRHAQDEKKIIFLDCGASWCIPCKKFANEVLTIDSVAEFFNKHFVNVYLDLEKDEMPPVSDMPNVRSIPAIFFIDARQKKVIHGHFGLLDAPSLMRFAKEACGDQSIAAMRQRYLDRQLSQCETAIFLQNLRDCRYNDEYRQYLPEYLNQLTIESLQDSCIWKFCEQTINDVNSPVFQMAWNNKQILFELYGKERVMSIFTKVLDEQIAWESKWKNRPNTFSDSFDQLCSWVTNTDDIPLKQNYLVQLEAEKYARAGETEKLTALLERIWKNNWDNDRKKTFIRKYIRKIYSNGSPKEQKRCIAILNKFIKQTQDKSTKIDFLFTEKDIWEKLGNPSKAQEAETRAQKLMNPHLFK